MGFAPDEITVPPLELSEEEEREFRNLWSEHTALGGWINYDLCAPKHLFFRWLAECAGYLLHGTGDPGIERVEPRHQTDVAQRSVKGVFAASDGIWPIYFALTNRSERRGSLRNGCTASSGGGRVYYFSVNQEWLKAEPWRDGVIYVFEQAGFQRCKTADDVVTEEWMNPSPVFPVARIPVSPEDFPYLDRVTGHDDSELYAFRDALEAAVRPRRQPSAYRPGGYWSSRPRPNESISLSS
ncbi:MAG: hypothetical protein KY447_09975 [Actinobacteria bacterium]|nr:hypothetical protein [Actinomycetota bacterium]